MMKIVLPKYATNYDLLPVKTEEGANSIGLSFIHKKLGTIDDYVIYWGLNECALNYGHKYGVMETGFFNNASFIDTVGNYQSLSLNSALGYKAIADFQLNGRKSAKDIIMSLPSNKRSKYNPDFNRTDIKEWTGPILILQNPNDRSIYNVTSREKYLTFIKECCKFYGKNLFVKFHPWNSGDIYKELENIVKPFGCQYGKASIGIISKAQFCISYNSTFAIDSILRGVPYVQYGIGTFYSVYGVIYSAGKFPTEIVPIKDAYKLPDFLIHKFCFNKGMEKNKFAKMINHYAESNELFPMTDEFSYANNLPK